MANKLKKSTPKVTAEKPVKTEKAARSSKPASDKLKSDREKKIESKKSPGMNAPGRSSAPYHLGFIFLFIAFVPLYFFTLRSDDSQ